VADALSDAARLNRMGVRAREWVLHRFDWSALVPQAARIFGESLRPSRSAVGSDSRTVGTFY
jgi:hypothetical protein